MFTKNPSLSSNAKTEISGSVTGTYASAIENERCNLTLNIGGRQWASLTSVTYGSFGDVVQGKHRNDKYPLFGQKPFIVIIN